MTLAAAARRLDEPLRVAIAGRIKAGKSTLLNALVGQELAATDAGECTRIVTWYRDGHTYRVMAYPHSGPPRPLPPGPAGGVLDVSLGGLRAEEVDRLVVDWPSAALSMRSPRSSRSIRNIRRTLPSHSTVTNVEWA